MVQASPILIKGGRIHLGHGANGAAAEAEEAVQSTQWVAWLSTARLTFLAVVQTIVIVPVAVRHDTSLSGFDDPLVLLLGVEATIGTACNQSTKETQETANRSTNEENSLSWSISEWVHLLHEVSVSSNGTSSTAVDFQAETAVRSESDASLAPALSVSILAT